MTPVSHPGRLLKRELAARKLSANRLSLDIGVPSGRITDILNGPRSITQPLQDARSSMGNMSCIAKRVFFISSPVRHCIPLLFAE